MAGPWEAYQQSPQQGPWAAYQQTDQTDRQFQPSQPAGFTRGMLDPDAAPAHAESAARSTYDDSPWYARPFIAAGAELNSLGRGIGQILTPNDSAAHKALTAAADADVAAQSGVHGASGFIGRGLPYLATLPIGGPEAGILSRVPQAGRAAQLAIKAGTAAAEGAGYGALRDTRTGESRLENAGIGALAGVAGRGLQGIASTAAKGTVQALSKAQQDAIATARKYGIPLSVGQVTNSYPVKIAQSVTKYLPFSGAKSLAGKQQAAFNEAATGLTGTPSKVADPEWLSKAYDNTSRLYDDIWSRNQISLSPAQAQRMASLVAQEKRSLTPDGAKVLDNQFNDIIDSFANNGGQITGKAYQALRKQLNKVTGNEGVKALRDELVSTARASLGQADSALHARADRQWNNVKTLDDLLRQATSGSNYDINPVTLWGATNKRTGPKSTQELRDLAQSGRNLLKEPIGDSGTAPRSFLLNLLGGGAGAAAAVAHVLPQVAALSASGVTMGRALNSPTLADLLAIGASRNPSAARALSMGGRIASRLPYGAVAGRQQPPLEIDISGGIPGAAPTPEEMARLRAKMMANAAGQ